jgi:hypothetical protein
VYGRPFEVLIYGGGALGIIGVLKVARSCLGLKA